MSSSIQHVQTALQSLRKAATRGKTKKSVLENIDNVSSSTVLLNSSAPSAHAFDKLVSVFRVPLVPLYSNYTEASLNVASAVLKVVLNNGIRPCLLEGDYRDIERQMGWERVAHSLLSGVIDFIESDNNEKTKTCVAKALYAPICNFFFFKDKSAKTEIGANLRCTAYMLLSDTSTLHHDNQARLRDQKVLGGRALGLAISKTRDFVVLETLLNLFAILLPSCSMSKEKHSAYIRDVFSDCRKEIAELLDYIPTREWDETATKVVDILSASDISFPQPFDVDEVVVCDNKYPQPEISDRFYIDRTSFFVNVQQEDGMYESLQIAYTNVKEIKITSSGAKEKTTPVNVTLKAIPMIGDQALSTGTDSLTLLVEILNSDMPRFKEALQHRNLGEAIAGAKRSRVSVSESALLDFDEDGMQWEEAPPSPSQKAKDVESFYESEPFLAPIGQLQAVKDDVLPDIVSIAKTAGAPPGKVESKNSGRSSAIPKLNASVFGGTDEDLSDINKAESVSTLDVKIKSVKAGKKVPAAPATSKPAQVIILSDNDAATEIKPAPRGGKGSKRRPQRRVDSDEEATKESKSELAREEKQARSVEFGYSAKVAASKKAPNSASRAKGKPAVEKKAEKATKTDDGNIPAGRPRRTAATTASAKLATAFADSEDTNTFEAPQDDDPLFNAKNAIEDTLESADPSPTAQEPFTKTFKAAQTAKKTQTEKPYIRAPVPLENIAPRSSSPISKISRMKAKNPLEKAKFVKTRAQKRTTDQAFVADDQKTSLRKKTRVDIENAIQGEDEGDNLNADHPRIDTSHPPLKYGHRGRKAKASPALQNATVDWDQVPTEASVAIKTNQREESSPIVPLKMTSPVKASVKKKENTSESKSISKKSTALAPKKTEAKPRPRDRTPLQTIVQVPNEASEEPGHVVRPEEQLPRNAPVDKKLKNRQPANTAPAREKAKLKESILPSLEDILLKGAIVEKVEVEQAENVEVDDEIITYDNGDAESKFKIGYAEDFSFPIMDLDEGPVDRGEGQQGQTDKCVADLQDEPRTPMPEKKAMESSPIPNVFNSQPSKKAPELDIEMIDLTDEDIKEVLQSLRARRAKSRQELGEATRLQESTRGSPIANDEPESSPEEHDAPDMQEMLSRPKVKFDDNLRYKSASLESLTGQQSAESLIVGNAGRKHRLPGSKHASRGPIESTSRKRQESQMKKEPGMEEIVNVLDAIQNAVLSNIANKSRAVRSDIRIARDRLIHEAVADLHEMKEESIGHYNNLFTLESEYANMNRKLITGLETVTNVNTDICKFVRQTINAHGRGSLSKKMPQSLFNSALPQSFLKFT